MERNSKQLTTRLIELRNAIKRKYKIFKDGAVENDIMLEKQYKPIIQELRKTTSVTPNIKIEKEEEEEPMDYDSEEGEFIPPDVSTPKPRELSQLASNPSTTQFVENYFQNPVTRDYMTLFMKDVGNNKMVDYVYGPRYEDGDTLMIGDKKLDFDAEGNIIINGTNYGASEGLYELIFKKVPDHKTYTEKDLKAYKSILYDTNAYREGYEPSGKVKRNKGSKYTTIIRNLFPATRGRGLAWKPLQSRDIVHWDDANELVDRLRHVAMSTETGNRVHGNEILSIVEELKEAGYIKGAGNSRFKALLE